jgi:hypothetical protein
MLEAVGPPVRVGRLTVRGGGQDPAAVRSRATSQLERMDLQPASLPPAAVLVIRRLRDPTPGRLSLDQSAHMAPWAGAVRDRVATLYRAAERPAAGPVHADAEAVVFADESELLATFAIDILHGTSPDHWWWRATLGGGTLGIDTLARVLVLHPSIVPATFRRLADSGLAISIARRLSAAQARAVVEATTRAFGLPELPKRPHRVEGSERDRSDTRPEDRSDGPHAPVSVVTGVPPPESWAGDDSLAIDADQRPFDPPLAWEQHVLLEIALALAGSPAIVRDPRFPDRVAATWRGQGSRGPASEPSSTRSVAMSRTAPDRATARTSNASDLAAQHGVDGVARNASERARSDASNHSPPVGLRSDPPNHPRDPAAVGAAASPRIASSPVSETELLTSPAPSWVGESDTSLGGFVFLVNVMAHLELPEVFQRDWQLSSRVGPWGVLELLARGLLDSAPESWLDDDLWAVLADLDGRTEGRPGDGLRRNPSIRLPRSWLQTDLPDAGVLRWAPSRDRIIAWSSHGYLVLDEPLGDGKPNAAVARAAADLGLEYDDRPSVTSRAPGRLRAGALVRDLSPAAIAWLQVVVPFVRRRLALALGRPSVTRQTTGMLLRRQAHLYVAAAHLDVVMRLGDVSLAARKAGLDQDPGWQPAFGRVIRIHFE